MNLNDIMVLKGIVLDRKLELLKFKKKTGGSVMDDSFIEECDRLIGELEKEEDYLKQIKNKGLQTNHHRVD